MNEQYYVKFTLGGGYNTYLTMNTQNGTLHTNNDVNNKYVFNNYKDAYKAAERYKRSNNENSNYEIITYTPKFESLANIKERIKQLIESIE